MIQSEATRSRAIEYRQPAVHRTSYGGLGANEAFEPPERESDSWPHAGASGVWS